jgi:hypothetical protein
LDRIIMGINRWILELVEDRWLIVYIIMRCNNDV